LHLRGNLIDPASVAYYAASSSAPTTALSPRLRSVGCWANSRYRQHAFASRICSGVGVPPPKVAETNETFAEISLK
jgi:hypothetical protein